MSEQVEIPEKQEEGEQVGGRDEPAGDEQEPKTKEAPEGSPQSAAELAGLIEGASEGTESHQVQAWFNQS